MKPHCRKYIFRMVIGFVAYALGIFAANYFNPGANHKYWTVLFPVIPIILIAGAIIGFVAEGLDELQRKVVTEAAAFSGIATGFTCFSYLFLRNMGAPEFHAEWAFYMMWGYYGVGAVLANLRYR